MAFDACMIAAITDEINRKAAGGRVEKITQPEKDEVIFYIHSGRDTVKLSVSASANCPRINFTAITKENPLSAPMFCMLLRKHLAGGRFIGARQLGFERAVELSFESADEMGFKSVKYIIVEVMGKYSNIIFCDEKKKILSPIKAVDFTTSQKRQVLPGMIYEMPPPQDKRSPLDVSDEEFMALRAAFPDLPPDKFIMNNFLGISSLTAREIAYKSIDDVGLCEKFRHTVNCIIDRKFTPVIVRNTDGSPLEYSFMPINQYGNKAVTESLDSFGDLIDVFFGTREKSDRMKQRANDILKLLTNIEGRIQKKLMLQREDLRKCDEKESVRLCGDLITANIYRMKRGMESVSLPDYNREDMAEVVIELDSRLTPAQNAQKYYKKYNKLKSAERELKKQIENAEAELSYIYTVFDAAAKAETESDLGEIRRELYESGYGSRMKSYGYNGGDKKKSVKPLSFTTPNGYTLLCGKNNVQNDHITTRMAEKYDLWFHVKNSPGSHVVLVTNGQAIEDIPDIDITRAAETAALYSSKKGGQNIAVDYTFIKNVKKPSGSKPGYVIYSSNWTAYVTPDEAEISGMRKDR